MNAPGPTTNGMKGRRLWFLKAAAAAIGSATFAVTLAARNLLFPDDTGTLVVVLALAGLAFSFRVLAGASRPMRGKHFVNSGIIALAALALWSYLVQTGAVGGWFDLGGLNLWRISMYEFVRTMLMGILWLTALRCFAVYSQRDLMLTLVPDLSMLLLICVLDPIGQAGPYVVWFAVSSWLALAADQKLTMLSQTATESRSEVRDVVAPEARTSLTSVAVVLLVAFLLSSGLMRGISPSSNVQGTSVQLAWYLARFMVDTSRTQFGGFTGPISVAQPAPPVGNQVMFRVRSDLPGYWRSRCYEEFDGATWRDARLQNRRIEVESTDPGPLKTFHLLPPSPKVAGEPGRRVVQRFEVRTIQMGTLLSLGYPIEVRAPMPMELHEPMPPRRHSKVRMNEHGCLSCSKSFIRGESYSVVALVPEGGADTIFSSRPPGAETLQACLQETEGTKGRTHGLARKIIGRAASNEGKAKAIADYLRSQYTYSLGVGPYPRTADAVDYFLFEAKSGYCVQFASAMTMLCRAVGVPARLATGFATGEREFGGLYNVRESDAHAWVEVYLRDNVWKQFDPTPGGAMRTAAGEPVIVRVLSDAVRGGFALLRDALALSLGALDHWLTFVAFVGAVLIFIIIAVAIGRRQGFLKPWPLLRRRSGVANRGIHPELRALCDQFLNKLRRIHRPRHPAETLSEYAEAATVVRSAWRAPAHDFVNGFERARYGQRIPTSQDLRALKLLLKELGRKV